MSRIDTVLAQITGLDEGEVRTIAKQVFDDLKNFPADVQKQQLEDAGWVSDPSGAIWLPPKGTEPYRPYQRYSGWKRMREMSGL